MDQAPVLALVVEALTSVPVASLTANAVAGNYNIPIARIHWISYDSWEIIRRNPKIGGPSEKMKTRKEI